LAVLEWWKINLLLQEFARPKTRELLLVVSLIVKPFNVLLGFAMPASSRKTNLITKQVNEATSCNIYNFNLISYHYINSKLFEAGAPPNQTVRSCGRSTLESSQAILSHTPKAVAQESR